MRYVMSIGQPVRCLDICQSLYIVCDVYLYYSDKILNTTLSAIVRSTKDEYVVQPKSSRNLNAAA
jgi:hypothetical protein